MHHVQFQIIPNEENSSLDMEETFWIFKTGAEGEGREKERDLTPLTVCSDGVCQ